MINNSILFHFKKAMLYFLTCFFLVSISLFTFLNFINESSVFEKELGSFEAALAFEKDKLLYARIVGSNQMIEEKLARLSAKHNTIKICTNLKNEICPESGKRIYIDSNKAYFVQVDSSEPLIFKALTSITNFVFLTLFLITMFALNGFLKIWLERNLVRPLMDFAIFCSSFRDRRREGHLPKLRDEFAEWTVIKHSINKMMDELDDLEREVAVKATTDLARQVAHDIRSPLTALNTVVDMSSELSPDKRQLIRSAAERISQIAEDLLLDRDSKLQRQENLYDLIDSVLAEKRVANEDVRIDFLCSSKEIGCARLDPANLKRIVSNILENSLESLAQSNSKRISLDLSQTGNTAFLEIKDTGCGIPEGILRELGVKKVSYGKEGRGNGIGLLNAIHKLKQNGDNFEIASKIGQGTIVRLTLTTR